MLQASSSSLNYDNDEDETETRAYVSLKTTDDEEQISQEEDEERITILPISRFRMTLPQVLATTAQSLLLLALGMMISAPTIVIAALLNTKTESFSMNGSEASWFVGILMICQPLGSILSGFIQEWIGRKKCMLLVNIPQLIGWWLINSSKNVEMLYIASTLMGFSVGFMEAPTLSYVGEISQPHLRGTLASFTSTYISLGYFLMYLLGSLTKWRTAVAIASSVPIITFLAILMIPESPIWLINKKKMKEAEKSLCWLRGWVSHEYIMKELADMIVYCETSKIQRSPIPINEYSPVDSNEVSVSSKIVTFFKDITRTEMMKPLRLVVIYFFFYHCASLSGFRPYMVGVFSNFNLPVGAHIMTVIGAVLQITGGFGCMILVSRTGKRLLSLISMACCTAACIFLGIYSYQLQHPYIIQPWIPFTLFCCLFFFTNLGISPISWSLLSEVFPSRGRGIGGGLSAAVYYIEYFSVSKTFLDLKSLLNLYGVFFFYGSLGFIGILFLYFCLPETEGKKLEDVEKIFAKRRTDVESR
ncbi:facilitated trehalose transporter Tret1-2 homolog [Lycorma delicatula]|uniref:facilitated trehalose transporter Tret1-2 homolog n=1 Tax=Lycorma delicatula TaxID=130591 RepID=UPI003F50EC79